MFNSDAVQNGNWQGGAKEENARTTELPTSAVTSKAHEPDVVQNHQVYKPKKMSFPDGSLGMGNKSK